jgi:hypothetical protein
MVRGKVDLRAALPRLLPGAIAWAQAQAAHVAAVGITLNEAGLDLARRVGVADPARIRIKFVRAIPLPDDPTLSAAAVQAGLLGPKTVGLTLGHNIFVRDGHLTTRVVSHECRHVHQYETQGSIEAFLPIYLAQVISLGYPNAPFELDAQAHEISA